MPHLGGFSSSVPTRSIFSNIEDAVSYMINNRSFSSYNLGGHKPSCYKILRMNIKSIFSYCFVMLLSANAMAGGFTPADYCARGKGRHIAAKTTVADPTEYNYDIKHLVFDLTLNDSFRAVQGNVSTTAMVTASSMPVYTFELDTTFTIDSFKLNGTSYTVQTSGGTVRKVTLSTALSQNTSFTAQVFYHGIPPVGSGFFNGVTQSITVSGVHMFYTVSDPYVAKDWWPCKQDIQDKIDSVDMWVTVPSGQKVGSNGLLVSTTYPSASTVQYHWSTHYAIDYYLISLAIAPYTDYSSYMHFTGSSDSMLIENFFYDTATFVPAYKANFDSLSYMIDYLSTLFGRYPFWKEKYGVCYSTLGGGMEHQTMTTIGVTMTPLIAHELGHQWFGDHVTYRTWPHVWVSEGFATYTEQLFINKFWGAAAMLAYRTDQYNYVMSNPSGRVYIDDTTSPYTLFNQRLVYDKGAGVLHMLRFLAPQDSLFFTILKTYQQQYAFGNANTDDLKAIAASVYGQNLDTFFNQWVYEQGYPIYSTKWNQIGNTVYVALDQTTSLPSSVAVFFMPVELQFHSAAGDTIIKVYNDQASQLYSFTWGNTVTGMAIDPNNWIINDVGSITHDNTVQVSASVFANIKVYPNPSKDYWRVDKLPADTELSLTDSNGKTVWTGRSSKSSVSIPGKQLAPGNYILKLKSSTGDTSSVSLVHW